MDRVEVIAPEDQEYTETRDDNKSRAIASGVLQPQRTKPSSKYARSNPVSDRLFAPEPPDRYRCRHHAAGSRWFQLLWERAASERFGE